MSGCMSSCCCKYPFVVSWFLRCRCVALLYVDPNNRCLLLCKDGQFSFQHGSCTHGIVGHSTCGLPQRVQKGRRHDHKPFDGTRGYPGEGPLNIITINSSSYQGLLQQLDRIQADFILVQEFRSAAKQTLSEGELRHKCWQKQWASYFLPGQPTGKGGYSAGVGFLWKAHLEVTGLRTIIPARCISCSLVLDLRTTCHITNICGHAYSPDATLGYIDTMIKEGCFSRHSIVAGDWNISLDTVYDAIEQRAAKGTIIRPDENTCIVGSGSCIDFFWVADALVPNVAGYAVLTHLLVYPHYPVQLVLHSHKMQAVPQLQRRKACLDRVEGPAYQGDYSALLPAIEAFDFEQQRPFTFLPTEEHQRELADLWYQWHLQARRELQLNFGQPHCDIRLDIQQQQPGTNNRCQPPDLVQQLRHLGQLADKAMAARTGRICDMHYKQLIRHIPLGPQDPQ